MIELRHLKKTYENAEPLKDVSVTVNDGDVVSVIGSSGTGKSTLIRCINLLEKPTDGQIILNGEEITAKGYDVRKARRKMGMVFQSFNLFGHLTVIENLMTPPIDLLGKSRQEAYEKGIELLRRVGLADKALNYPNELSGGHSSALPLQGRWRWTRKSFFWMSLPAPWTRPWCPRCRRSSGISPAAERP